ncbi:MAG: methionyl-tRNA formyltransferase [candidate division NC10 bacterium]|nr:methionyl-tRNA formyltransferase [candidate division NC10 bacterium]
MKVLFMGTPSFALPCLLRLKREGYPIVAVLTRPDRPAGRGKLPTPPPVKSWAHRLDIPVRQPEKLKDPGLLSSLQALQPDLGVVVAYGKLLPSDLLYLPLRGCINVHASLLPRYRGAAPMQRALMAGEKITGITVLQMDEGMDTGPILLQAAHPILPSDNAGTLHDRLAILAPQILVQALEGLREGRLRPIPQREEEATYAPPLKNEEGFIRWERPAQALHHLIRALSPQPGAYCFWRGNRIKVLRAKVREERNLLPPPGSIVALESHLIGVATGGGILLLLEVQPEGKRSMHAGEFARGQRLQVGDSFASGGSDGE